MFMNCRVVYYVTEGVEIPNYYIRTTVFNANLFL